MVSKNSDLNEVYREGGLLCYFSFLGRETTGRSPVRKAIMLHFSHLGVIFDNLSS
jgi:hypothetical protein